METIQIAGDVQTTLGRVAELKADGLVIDRDFTWTFTPYSHDWMNNETVQPSCRFTFTDDRYASYYALRWA